MTMTYWADFDALELSTIKNRIKTSCEAAAGITMTTAQSTTFNNILSAVIESMVLANVHCLYGYDDGEGVIGIVAAGRPYMPEIVGLLRNSDASFTPDYGRRTSTASVNKSGTEQVALSGNAGTTVEEKITIGAPDIRAATVGNITAEDVDAGEKYRFDAEPEKSLYILLGKWIKRASVPADL